MKTAEAKRLAWTSAGVFMIGSAIAGLFAPAGNSTSSGPTSSRVSGKVSSSASKPELQTLCRTICDCSSKGSARLEALSRLREQVKASPVETTQVCVKALTSLRNEKEKWLAFAVWDTLGSIQHASASDVLMEEYREAVTTRDKHFLLSVLAQPHHDNSRTTSFLEKAAREEPVEQTRHIAASALLKVRKGVMNTPSPSIDAKRYGLAKMAAEEGGTR